MSLQVDNPMYGQATVFRATASCAHCGADTPRTDRSESCEPEFCCSGCEVAWRIIHEHGLSAFYDMTRQGAKPESAAGQVRFVQFDDPEFLAEFAHCLPGGRMRITLAINSIHCVACVWLLEKLPQVLPGVERMMVRWDRRTAELSWHPQVVALSEIARLMDRLGYAPLPFREEQQRANDTREFREQLIRLGAAGAAAGNNMLIALALYLGWFAGMDAAIEWLLRWASCAVGMVSLLWPGRVFFQSAWAALKMRVPHMDLPIALGLGVGGISGLVNTWRGLGEIYFDSLSVLVFLLLIGRFVQSRQQRRAADSIDLLYRLTPRFARKIVDGLEIETRAELLRVGDTVEVRAGELIPADGRLLDGRAVVDESLLTGESIPQERVVDEVLAAGTLNLAGAIRLEVTSVGHDTRVGKLMRLVEQGAGARPQIVQWANRIGGYFVVVVIGLAVVTIALWASAGWDVAVDRAAALLIVACPCALAMATPLALAVALGSAARRGILIKGGDVLQRLLRPGMIWLDKTGTLTRGEMRVVEWIGDEDALRLAAAVEAHSAHPIARAIMEYANQQVPLDATAIPVDSVQQSTQGGISGMAASHTVAIGNAAYIAPFLEKNPLSNRLNSDPIAWESAVRKLINAGLSPVFVVLDGECRGIAGVGDPLRENSAAAVNALRDRGWTVGILSGDHPQIVAAIGEQLGLASENVHGGVLPEHKVDFVSQGQQGGDPARTVVMVGDGVNDSAALAAASVGIAVHGGSEVSLQAAPVYLNRPGLDSLIELIDGSRNTMFVIRRNLIVSLAYNALGVGLAMSGVLNPLIAAVLMPISSLTVVSLSLTGSAFRDPR
ncbi:MAG TPA: heavy metal translocating P-type ATPase [Pirellulaceae bacterium]|nr:heavy metal translocating P-type ATPase [Pirellulaceae bacterium]